jgi:hypothetical protein
MARIIISRPFFVLALSVFTLLLLWQDVNARGHYLPDRDTPTKGPEAAPPVAQPAEAPAETVTGAELAQESGKGTMTVDGETRSFAVLSCRVRPADGENYRVDGQAKDDAGSTLHFNFDPNSLRIMVRKLRKAFFYINLEKKTEVVFRVDGSTVTVDGFFKINNATAATSYSIQLSFDCSG